MRAWVQLAAGSGSRFGGKHPKQFQRLSRKPLLLYAIETFLRLHPTSPVIVVLPLAYFRYGEKLLREAFPTASLHLAVGGMSRSASTEAALHLLEQLELLSSEHTIAFHDAARPFPSPALVERTFAAAESSGAVVCGLPVSFSVRIVEQGGHSQALPREKIWEIQTPQAFRGDILKRAWRQLAPTADPAFTDEGSWIEAAGFPISLVLGEASNLKITYPSDWEIARLWLKRKSF